MALLTVEELRASPEAITADVIDLEDATIQVAIDDAEVEITARLGYGVDMAEIIDEEEVDTSLTIEGEGRSLLVVPARIRAITSITEDGETTDPTYYRIDGGGFHLHRVYGSWALHEEIVITGTFGFESTDEEFKLAKRAVKLLAIARLQGNIGDFPVPPGAFLTNFSSENASFDFFTPQSSSGVPEVDRLINLIGPLRILA